MYEIAEQVSRWLDEGRSVRLATLVETRGFSSRARQPFFAWTPGLAAIGTLLADDDVPAGGAGPADDAGSANSRSWPSAGRLPIAAVEAAGSGPDGLVDLTVSDADAGAAGLSCGGLVRLLVQDADTLPRGTWSRLARRDPLCLVTGLPRGETAVFDVTDVNVATERFGPLVARVFARGTTTAAVAEHEAERAVVVALWPTPNLVVVGDGLIAAALTAQAALLGWTSAVAPDVPTATTALAALSKADAVVVLSHDRAVDGPVLAAALAGHVGYVGALGSRRTQAARALWLDEHGVGANDIARIHGPAGLDVGAYSPAEIAVSIVAEILSARTATAGGSLGARAGPVHLDGVNAPPPRYPVR